MDALQRARGQLREIARAVEGIRYRLLGAHASVPLSFSERNPLAEVDVTTDPVADFHGALESILDKISALVEDILEAAGLPSESEGETGRAA